jgi:uncharacterized membrane protein YdjX (TVP38/TMEM64 family)
MENDHLSSPEEELPPKRLPLVERLPKRTLNIIRAVVLLFVIALTAFLFIQRERIQELQAFGYPGIFLFSLLANATILVPVPGVLFTTAMGAVFNPFWVSIAAGTGAALGELSGYLAGFSGQPLVENSAHYDQVVNWMRRYGDITILILAFIPNPLFDMAGMLYGMLKMPVTKFLIYCLIGKVLKMMMFAYAGDWLIGMLKGVF